MFYNLIANTNLDPCTGEFISNCTNIFSPILENLRGDSGSLNVTTVTKLISWAASIFLVIIVSFSVLSLLMAAWNMITDNGDGTNFGKGTKRFMYAIFGLLFALLAFTVVSFIVRSLGVRGVRNF
ncbi:MAG: hypothetical protein ACRCXZ_02590 [Patescibacteria group bacterium]